MSQSSCSREASGRVEHASLDAADALGATVYNDLDWSGLDFSKRQFEEIMIIDREQWKVELLSHAELFERMYDKLPKEFIFMRELLLSSLWRSP